jgi:uncharacterized membrane protein HdeD (DUF308 family)
MGGLLRLLMQLIGIAWIIVGTVMIFAPEVLRDSVLRKVKDVPIKPLSIIPGVAGILLLLAARYNRHTFFIVLLGILAIVKGVLGFTATEKLLEITKWWIKLDINIYRAVGVVIIIIGSVVLMGI